MHVIFNVSCTPLESRIVHHLQITQRGGTYRLGNRGSHWKSTLKKLHHRINRWTPPWGSRIIWSLIALKVVVELVVTQSCFDTYTDDVLVHLVLIPPQPKPLWMFMIELCFDRCILRHLHRWPSVDPVPLSFIHLRHLAYEITLELWLLLHPWDIESLQRHAQAQWLVPLTMLPWITKIILEQMALMAMFATHFTHMIPRAPTRKAC
jgi:hypothetical protein